MSFSIFIDPLVFPSGLTDVDECKEQPDICNGGRCDNLPGEYRCICNGGLTASPDQKRCLGMLLVLCLNLVYFLLVPLAPLFSGHIFCSSWLLLYTSSTGLCLSLLC